MAWEISWETTLGAPRGWDMCSLKKRSFAFLVLFTNHATASKKKLLGKGKGEVAQRKTKASQGPPSVRPSNSSFVDVFWVKVAQARPSP